jgi:hypothetical protein
MQVAHMVENIRAANLRFVTGYDPKADRRGTLRELLDGSHARTEEVPVAVGSYLVHRGPVALAMGDFYR